mgnify:CR=1 FL=1
MTTFRITDIPDTRAKAELFLGGAARVLSHSGMHPTEALLIERLAHLPEAPTSLLVAGNRTGVAAMIAASLYPGCSITCHAFDLHHARSLCRNLAANGLRPDFSHDSFVSAPPDIRMPASDIKPPSAVMRVACTSALPPGPYAAILFMATPGTMTGELILDQLEDIHRNLAPGGFCLLACEAESAPLLKQVNALFGNVSVTLDRKGLLCASAVKREPLARARDFSASFAASLPGGAPLTLRSLPGVFCHRRPDAGGLALAEVAARDLRDGQRVLDFGCGCGLVGLLLARHRSGVRVSFLDSHARALAATRLNLESLGIEGCELLLSDAGTSRTGFDLFVGNPPYYSDFRIAERFAEAAREALCPGGACLLVAKSAARLRELACARFGNAEVVSRRGYGVVRSLR